MGSNNPVNYGGAANVAPAQNVYPPQQGGAPSYAPPSPSYPAQASRGIDVVRAQLTKFPTAASTLTTRPSRA
ncbi:hypothetical protein AGDE_12902 [Angomonas deanei]|nr:hypothetical protein AGDE_12902 [Angomonas deanei]|eukprot:EPY23306.1 hypothetical protein AGDE_12902 [Angomonas deanei]